MKALLSRSLTAESVSANAKSLSCVHCGSPSRSEFCCAGCEAVYSLLNENGLSKYYELKSVGRRVRKSVPPAPVRGGYAYLDDPEFVSLYALAHGSSMRFYLQGAHCTACVWLAEKVPSLVPGVESVTLDLGSSVATVRINPDQSRFSEAAHALSRLGFRPHPVLDGDEDQHEVKDTRALLTRLSVAGACAGNIMLLAVCLYGGASGGFQEWFRWLSFALAIPVVTYSAVPFYQNVLAGFRSKTVSIDVPIAIGIVLTTLSSVYNLMIGSPHIYFDSITSLIF